MHKSSEIAANKLVEWCNNKRVTDESNENSLSNFVVLKSWIFYSINIKF